MPKKTITGRTQEQLERIAIIRAINDEVSAGLEIRHYRWERAVAHAPTQALQAALTHLQEARKIIQTVSGGATEGGGK
jgi:hypothetical protein